MDAVEELPFPWKLAWTVGAFVIITLGLTVLVAIPGSFFVPLILLTTLILKLGAPDDIQAPPVSISSVIGHLETMHD